MIEIVIGALIMFVGIVVGFALAHTDFKEH